MFKDLIVSCLFIVAYGLIGGLLIAYGLDNGIKKNYLIGSASIVFSMLILLKGYTNLTLIFKRHY